MKLIAHRGLVDGPNYDLENTPDQIKKSIDNGYDCEIDVWYVNNCWFLGHDAPRYQISSTFLEITGLWIHAKNIDALLALHEYPTLNYFWHQTDHFTLTSQGNIWTYPGQPLTKNSIMVMPEWQDLTLHNTKNLQCLGICSDFINVIQKLILSDR
jgi:hypothetical protein